MELPVVSKLCFLVEAEFFHHHVGVRNLVLSLHEILSEDHEIDMFTCWHSETGETHWFQLVPDWKALGVQKSTVFQGNPQNVWSQYLKQRRKSKTPHEPIAYRIDCGTLFSGHIYDACIITNPWLVDFNERLPFKKIFGIVYDIVPNLYVFSKDNKPHDFAARHLRGFQYFNRFCDKIIAISDKTKTVYDQVFPKHAGKTIILPPIMPASYFTQTEVSGDKRPQNVILAGPFDLRKGLKIIPQLLSKAAPNITNLYIYGALRCSELDAEKLFDTLKPETITWVINASPDEVKSMYAASKFLLFPSAEEGLGLPIIEAQLMGARVVVQDAAPMNQIALDGAYFLTGDHDADATHLASMLQSDFAHIALANIARDRFSVEKVRSVLRQMLDTPHGSAQPLPSAVTPPERRADA